MNKLGLVGAGIFAAVLMTGAARVETTNDVVVAKLEELKSQDFMLAHAQLFMHGVTKRCRHADYFPWLCREAEEKYRSQAKFRALSEEAYMTALKANKLDETAHIKILLAPRHSFDATCDFGPICHNREAAVSMESTFDLQRSREELKAGEKK